MKIISPTSITDAMLDSSSVTEDDYSEWDVSTTYDADDFVIVIGSTHKVYKSVVGSNLGNDPITDDGTYWTEQSATNRWKAFDQKINAQVSDTDQIEYVFSGVGLVDGIALFGLEATEATLIIENGSPLVEVYNETIDLNETADVVDGYTYDFEPTATKSTYIFTEVPPYTNATYTLQIGAAAETCKVGQIVLGRTYNLGETRLGTEVGITDFSSKDRDSFGNPILNQRSFAETVDFDFIIDTTAAQRTRKVLSNLRALPVVYYAGDDTDQFGTTVYGFFQDFSVLLSGPQKSTVTMEVEGLV